MISLGGVVALEAVRVGSFDIDAAIQTYVRREYGIAIGERTAEEIKLAIGSASAVEDEFKAEVRGRDLMSGLPKTILLVPEEVRAAIEEQVRCHLRRGDRLPVADSARARPGPDPQRRPPRRGRRHAARARSAVVARRPICRCISSTRRSSASCSVPDVASRTSIRLKEMFMARSAAR